MSRKKPTRCVESSSVAVTSSFRPRTEIVARPAARRFRTHWTSPQGAQTQRLPSTSTIANGVVRGRPLFRPRMVTSPLGPIGMPAPRRNFKIGLKNRTRHGKRVRCIIATPHFDRSSAGRPQLRRPGQRPAAHPSPSAVVGPLRQHPSAPGGRLESCGTCYLQGSRPCRDPGWPAAGRLPRGILTPCYASHRGGDLRHNSSHHNNSRVLGEAST